MDFDQSRIRAMTTDDVDLVLALETQLQSHPWLRSHFDNCLAIGNLALVVEYQDCPVIAFAIVSIGGGEAELLNIAVDPAFQGRGVARRFLLEIISHIKDQAETIFLEVRPSNHQAIHLYESIGFNQVGVRPNYYNSATGREDALLYAMTLL